jgi:hypothetical protein
LFFASLFQVCERRIGGWIRHLQGIGRRRRADGYFESVDSSSKHGNICVEKSKENLEFPSFIG